MKLSLNVNLKDAMILIDVIAEIDRNIIHRIGLRHEMQDLNIDYVYHGLRNIARELNDFNKEFTFSAKKAQAIVDWLDNQTIDDTMEIMREFDEDTAYKYDNRICNLYGDLRRSLKQFVLDGGEI